MRVKVFISYKSEELSVASRVKDNLEANGISCWMAPMSIPGGSSYAHCIAEAIAQCTHLLLILSSKSQQSKWISRELDLALKYDKIILPYMIEQCELTAEYRYYLPNVQYYTAYEGSTEALNRMIWDIRKGHSSHTGFHPFFKTPKKRKGKWILLAMALAAVLGIIAICWGPIMDMAGATEPSDFGLKVTDPTDDTSNNLQTDSDNSLQSSTPADSKASNEISNMEPNFFGVEETPQGSEAQPLPNDSRETAVPLKLKQRVSSQLSEELVHWYQFSTNDTDSLYRISTVPSDYDPDSFPLGYTVTLFDQLGMKVEELQLHFLMGKKVIDIQLDTSTEYYIQVKKDFWVQNCLYNLSVNPLDCDSGTDRSTATEITLGQHRYALNATIPDWHVFTATKDGVYRFTIYNIDIDTDIVLAFDGLHPSVYGERGQSASYEFNVSQNDKIYLAVQLDDVTSLAEGHYYLIIEKVS